MILYVNGDSYSAPCREFKVYSEVLGEKLSAKATINEAMQGSSNDRIFRTTLEYIASLSNDQKPFVVLGFSFFTREEVWTDHANLYQNQIKDYTGSQFVTLDWLQKKHITDEIMHAIIDQNINSQAVHFYTKLYMLVGLLNGMGIPYFIFSAARNMDFRNLNLQSLDNLAMYQHILNDPNILNFKTFNIPLWAEQNNINTNQTGHLYEDGHELFADFLYNKIQHRL